MAAGLVACNGPQLGTGPTPMRTSGAYFYSPARTPHDLPEFTGARWDDGEGDYDDNDEDDEGDRGYGYRYTRYERSYNRYPDYPPAEEGLFVIGYSSTGTAFKMPLFGSLVAVSSGDCAEGFDSATSWAFGTDRRAVATI
eukprot:gene1425-1777_t